MQPVNPLDLTIDIGLKSIKGWGWFGKLIVSTHTWSIAWNVNEIFTEIKGLTSSKFPFPTRTTHACREIPFIGSLVV